MKAKKQLSNVRSAYPFKQQFTAKSKRTNHLYNIDSFQKNLFWLKVRGHAPPPAIWVAQTLGSVTP